MSYKREGGKRGEGGAIKIKYVNVSRALRVPELQIKLMFLFILIWIRIGDGDVYLCN